MIIPLIYTNLPAFVLKNSKILYKNKDHFEFESQNLNNKRSKIQSYKLDYNVVARNNNFSGSWTAIGKSVSSYYSKKMTGRRATSEIIKNNEFNLNQTNDRPTHSKNNLIKSTSNKQVQIVGSHLNSSFIKREIQEKRPVCVKFQQEGSSSEHCIVIYGYTQHKNKLILHIADPWDGYHDVDYEYLLLHFKANFINSYLTS